MIVVTGACGFIGSHLVQRLLSDGLSVRGVDCFTDYYPRADKLANLAAIGEPPGFTFAEVDLSDAPLDDLVEGSDVVVHLAAEPGVRASWGRGFRSYLTHNVLATHRLLDAVVRMGVPRVVLASSSSVYGTAESLPTVEHATLMPISPYGVTKHACEALAAAYASQWGVSVTILRYFTVYGPRQRPDMAIRRFIHAALTGAPVELYGAGDHVRDFTYVADVVEATARVALDDVPGTFNVGSASPVSIREMITTIEHIVGRSVPIVTRPSVKGDARGTSACIDRAVAAFGFQPTVSLHEGIEAETAWLAEHLERPAARTLQRVTTASTDEVVENVAG